MLPDVWDLKHRKYRNSCEISGFCRAAFEVFALLGYYAVQEEYLTLKNGTYRLSRSVGNQLQNYAADHSRREKTMIILSGP
jgi:hypothetical protein